MLRICDASGGCTPFELHFSIRSYQQECIYVMNYKVQNIFEAILDQGHDEDFVPRVSEFWLPTNAVAGSPQKLETLRNRAELGVPLFHPNDNRECLCTREENQIRGVAIRVVKTWRHRRLLLSE